MPASPLRPAALVALLLGLMLSACGGGGAAPAMAPTAAPADQLLAREAAEPTAAPAGTAAPAAPVAADVAAGQPVAIAPEPPPPTQQPQPAPELTFTKTEEDNLSTFAMDVDTASYTMARRYLADGQLPPPDLVRVEEFVNSFRYDYPAPAGDAAFGVSLEAAPSPFSEGAQLVRVGIKGREIDDSQRQDAVLTFVIDVSGSMQEPNRLPLVKQALRLLVEELRETDQVGIVVYGSQARVLLEHTGLANRERILAAIDSLGDEGSTNAEAGLRLGYQLAGQHAKSGAINRVILCSDGVANVGETGPQAILESIRDYAAQGIYLTTVGFGMGDYNDQLMEQLANDGDGQYAYVDDIGEARRVFVENLTGTLQVIAKDAKIQVEFNPAVVGEYRLLGYENRAVADADFRNDRVDAGEVGAGHSVTALYEVRLTGAPAEALDALTVQIRYADPQSGAVTELRQPLAGDAFGGDMAQASPHMQLAVAAAGFAEWLRSPAERSLDAPLAIAERVAPQLANDPDAQELLDLMRRARDIADA